MAPRRTFDHDEARRLHEEEGLGYAAIARRLGTSPHAARYAAAPREVIQKKQAATLEYVRARRREGHYYDYVPCSCGNLHDKRRPACGECQRDRRGPTQEQLHREERGRLELETAQRFRMAHGLRGLGLTYREISEHLGMSPRTVRRWLTERKKPPRPLVRR